MLHGNHDDRRGLHRHFGVPGAAGEPVQYAVDLGPMRLVVLDTTRPGEDLGALDPERLDWLDTVLAAEPGFPTLLAMHHPGLTAARWQVLGALVLAERALTVPQIARRMGLTRQAVQASVNRLRSAGLVDADENPDHRRSPLIRLTEVGAARYAALDRRQVRWINELAAGLAHSDLATTARVLQELSKRLDGNAPKRRKER